MNHPIAKEVSKVLSKASRSKTAREAFWALVNLMFCAIAKTTANTQEKADKLEADYMAEVKRWPVENIREVFPKAFALLSVHYPSLDRDHLGELAGEMEILSKDMGQFFTPMEVCRLMAAMTGANLSEQASKKPFVTVHEPAAGGGAMLLSMAKDLQDNGHDPGTAMWVEATELHHGTFQMCYVALSLAGLSGRVTHGNTLSGEVFSTHVLPTSREFVHMHGSPFPAAPKPRIRVRPKPPTATRVRPRP